MLIFDFVSMEKNFLSLLRGFQSFPSFSLLDNFIFIRRRIGQRFGFHSHSVFNCKDFSHLVFVFIKQSRPHSKSRGLKIRFRST